MTFVLTDEAAAALDEPLRADYETLTVSDRISSAQVLRHVLWNADMTYGASIRSPSMRRRAAAADTVAAIEDGCVRWIHRHLPGAFATTLPGSQQPTVLLSVSDKVAPLTEEAMQLPGLAGTGLDESYASWGAAEWPAARFAFPRAAFPGDSEPAVRRLLIGCTRTGAIPENQRPGRHEPESNWTIAQFAQEMSEGLGTRWAISCLLDGYHQLLASHRDAAASDLRSRPVGDLRELRRIVRTEAFDILAVSADVERFTENRSAYSRHVIEPRQTRDSRKHGGTSEGAEPEVDLIDVLRERQAGRAAQLGQETERLLSALGASAGFTQAISNIRLQRTVIALTLISIGLASLAILVATQ